MSWGGNDVLLLVVILFILKLDLHKELNNTNKMSNRMACKTIILIEFLNHHETKVTELDEIKSSMIIILVVDRLNIEDNKIFIHAFDVYTQIIFRNFFHEFIQIVSKSIVDLMVDGS